MLEHIRNIGIIAHVDAGKTTTTERILYFGGSKHKSGDVDDGNTTTDFDPLEKAKGITINSAAVSLEWGDKRITLIDTPGHVDFTAEVERSLRVLDGAVGVFCAVGGVEVQSETVWHQANRHGVPRLAFVNKLDRMGADFYDVIKQMEEKLSITPAVCTIPAGQSSNFEGVIDLVRMKFWDQDKDDPAHMKYKWTDIPAAYLADAQLWREKLLDAASHACDELLEAILEGQEISEEMLRKALRLGTLSGRLTPVHCGSSKEYHGVRLLLDAVRDYLPSPSDRPPVRGIIPKSKEETERKPEASEPVSALSFKTVSEKHGDLIFVRIYSGELMPGEIYLNTSTGKQERVSHIYRLFGDRRDRLEKAGPGEIVAVVGLKNTATGQTLCDTDKPVLLEDIRFPDPVISQALTPAKNVDETKLADALSKMVRDDPTLRCRTDAETSQLILSGMGELHLEVAVHKLQRDHGVAVEVGKPMVAYRQTLAKKIEFETRYIKQSGGRGKYAVIKMRYEPLTKKQTEELAAECEQEGEKPDPNNLYFVDEIFGGAVPTEYIPSVEHGFRQGCQKGAKYKFPVVDVRATLLDGKHHEVDSSADTFKLAALESFRDAQASAGLVILEPIMNVVVHAPGQYLGDLTRDVSRRRGEILNSSLDKGRCMVHAYVPLAELFGYTSELRNFTSGTASFTMEPSHYAAVKEELADIRAAS
ncbi:MAG: elongation factor G [Gemmataceae bacterium]|nr:elongation factor G [Gemmataceae bacterium]MCI0743052.1 elongation factor G [Gemmataceae bacterium]